MFGEGLRCFDSCSVKERQVIARRFASVMCTSLLTVLGLRALAPDKAAFPSQLGFQASRCRVF